MPQTTTQAAFRLRRNLKRLLLNQWRRHDLYTATCCHCGTTLTTHPNGAFLETLMLRHERDTCDTT